MDWVLYTYSAGNSNTVVLKGKGTGGVEELVEQLDDAMVAYGLVRLIERVDESDTVKFAYINWTGDNIPRMLRARLSTHSGAVKEFLSVCLLLSSLAFSSPLSLEIGFILRSLHFLHLSSVQELIDP